MNNKLKGRKQGKSWSSTSGIKLKQETLDEIINKIETKIKGYNSDLELHKSKPDVFITT